MKNLITATELLETTPAPDLLIVDCRFSLQDPFWGRDRYREGHIPGAVFASLDRDLSGPVGVHGGRHPLPSIEHLVELFSSLGIVNGETEVVAYDDGGGAYAARLWWLLRYLGHGRVRILDGGYDAFLRIGRVPAKEPGRREQAVFVPQVQPRMLASMEEVRSLPGSVPLVDARSPERYRGEEEVLDVKAGHIPGARNAHWKDNLDENGVLLPPEKLRARFSRFPPDAVMYCGSGVTACVNVLAMEEAGYPLPRLYAGSWSDWISYADNPVTVGGEPE